MFMLSKTRVVLLPIVVVLSLLSLSACGGSAGNCSVADNGDGTVTITCPDGSSVTVSNGKTTLVVNEALSSGDSNCPNGGYAVHTGVDANGNGQLETEEIEDTSYVCNGKDGQGSTPSGVLQGSYTIRNSLDLYFISGITEITGDLEVYAAGLEEVSLPLLESVGGGLYVHSSPQLATVSFDSLRSVGKDSIGRGVEFYRVDALRNIDFPLLESVDGDVLIEFCNSLISVSLPNLTSTGGYFIVDSSDVLVDISADKLTSVLGNFSICGNKSIESILFPVLKTVGGSLVVGYNDVLDTISLPVLQTVGEDLMIDSNDILIEISLPSLRTVARDLAISSNDVLTTISLPDLQAVERILKIDNNKVLTSVSGTSFPLLTEVGCFRVEGNDALVNISLDQFTSINVVGCDRGSVYIYGNESLTDVLMNGIRDVAGSMSISSNASLLSMSFNSLESVECMNIDNNTSLNIMSFESLSYAGENLVIYSNPSLCQSIVDALVAQLQAAGWSGIAGVGGNDESC